MFKWIYDRTIRPYLPRKVIVHNGIPALTGRLLDFNNHRKQWEEMLMAAIRNQPLEGCKIIEVAGGLGVCTAEMAKRAGPEGSVISYEVDEERVKMMARTLELNQVSDVVEIRNQLVKNITEDCDVLVLDCEGSERQILAGEYGNPDTVIVETHPVFDVPTEEIREILVTDGYEITTIRKGENIDIIEAHS